MRWGTWKEDTDKGERGKGGRKREEGREAPAKGREGGM